MSTRVGSCLFWLPDTHHVLCVCGGYYLGFAPCIKNIFVGADNNSCIDQGRSRAVKEFPVVLFLIVKAVKNKTEQ